MFRSSTPAPRRAIALPALFVALLAALGGAPPAVRAEVLYGVFGGPYFDSLLVIDRTTGEATEIGDMDASDPKGLDCAPDGTLWGSLGPGGLGAIVTVDRASGLATLIGESGFDDVAALAVAPDGTIYASVSTTGDADALATVDPASGAATLVGSYDVGFTGMVALAFDPAGTLHGVSNDAFGAPALYTIDRATGAATFVAMIAEEPGVPLTTSVRGLAFSSDGTLFASTEYGIGGYFAAPRSGSDGSEVVVVDPATGLLTTVGNTGFNVEALTFCDDAEGPSVFAILPARAGNGGPVRAFVYHDLVLGGGASVTLRRGGEPDIPGTALEVDAPLHRIRATFDLTDATPGERDVVVTDGADPANGATLAGGFTVVDGSLVVLRVTPATGGDTGRVTVVLQARNAAADAVVTLVRGGEEIAGSTVAVEVGNPDFFDPSTVTATLDLAGRALGAWDVVVTNAGAPGSPGVLPGGFTIAGGRPPDVSFNVVGPAEVRVGRPTTFLLMARNEGNVDTTAVIGILGVPEDAGWSVEVPPTLLGPVTPNAQRVETPAGAAVLLPAILLPPGVQRNAKLDLEATSEGDFQLRAFLVQEP